MKIKKILIVLVLSIFLSGCGVGVEKDLMSGQKTSYSGLTFDKMTSLYNGEKVSKNQTVELGDNIEIYFSEVAGFKKENGKVFPGASMIFVSNTGDEMVVAEDMFSDYSESGVDPVDAESMKLTATTGDPLESGQSYVLKIKIWDKKGDGKIESELNLTIDSIISQSNSLNNTDNIKQADNFLPMYGGVGVIKTPKMLQADEDFIVEVVSKTGTREKGSAAMIDVARSYLEKGDLETAMQRFNQAWLLDSNNKDVYTGFVEVLMLQGKIEVAEKISSDYLQ